MGYFYLVQRGSFTKNMDGKVGLTGCKGVVDLDKMGAAEYEFSAIPKAFRRIMWDYDQYAIYFTGIKNPNGDELKIFCRKDRADETLRAVIKFIESSSWKVKRYCGLPEAIKGEEWRVNFWWCIDIPNKDNCPDWMAFFESDEQTFKMSIANDYNDWWMDMTEEERKKEYEKALIW